MFDLKGRYKWDAWTKNKGTSREEAQSKYIAHVEFLKGKYAWIYSQNEIKLFINKSKGHV